MPNIQHASIPDADLHEIKGAASASAGQIPVANGSGSAPFGAVPSASTTVRGAVLTAGASPSITDSTGGTPAGAIAAISGSGADVALNNAISTILADLADLKSKLRTAGSLDV